jgi:hypothetical protein
LAKLLGRLDVDHSVFPLGKNSPSRCQLYSL